MTKLKLFAEILYAGFLSKKGNIYSNLQMIKMKKSLLREIELWLKICDRILINKYEKEDQELLEYFVFLCDNYPTIKDDHLSYYDLVKRVIKDGLEETSNYEVRGNYINVLMISLLNDLKLLLVSRKINYNKRKVYILFRVLHNLPIYFINNDELTYLQVMELVTSNMGVELKTKYKKLIDKIEIEVLLDEENPKWLGKAIVDDSLPWNKFINVNLKQFFEKYTLHDSAWIKLIVDPNDFNYALVVVRLDSVWFPNNDVVKTSFVSQWPILFLKINEVYNIDFKNYVKNDCGRTIDYANVIECDDCYQLEIGDIFGGVLTITYIGDTKALILNNNKEEIEIDIELFIKKY